MAIIDDREKIGVAIESLPNGTFLYVNGQLFLKASPTCCVDLQTGLQAPFNPFCAVQPVTVDIFIRSNRALT
jgi:hypothetical protein